MSLLEICISSDDTENLAKNIATAIDFGAERFELCGQMQHDGLTPDAEAVKIAKQVTSDRAHLAVMIRPRSGDFCYDQTDVLQMAKDIKTVAAFGADSVVFGLTNSDSNTIDKKSVLTLIEVCKQHNVGYVFHRAFDTLDEPVKSLKWLNEKGFSRVLTAGTRWGSNSTLEQGLSNIKLWLDTTNTNIEFIIGGGLNHNNISNALMMMAPHKSQVAYHTHSAVLEHGRVNGKLIEQFVHKIKQTDNG